MIYYCRVRRISIHRYATSCWINIVCCFIYLNFTRFRCKIIASSEHFYITLWGALSLCFSATKWILVFLKDAVIVGILSSAIPAGIDIHDGIVLDIGEQIEAQSGLASLQQPVGVQKASRLRIVVSGVQIVEFGLFVVSVSAIPIRIDRSQGSRCLKKDVAEGVVAVFDHNLSRSVQELHDVAQGVVDIEVVGSVVVEADQRSVDVVGVIERVRAV